jgi:predicted flap endonuclease-1-like 5' DNA nuclease
MKEIQPGNWSKCHLDDAVLAEMEPVISQRKDGKKKPSRPAKAKRAAASPASSTAANATMALAATAAALKPKPRSRKAVSGDANSTLKLASGTRKRAAKPASKSVARTAAAKKDAGKPKAIRKPAKPDDLKLISGVGPKLEGVLNGLGVYRFEQVGGWKKAEREWVDGYLNFKGRIERDDWVRQAKALAKGGEAEYIKVFGKKPR